MVSHIVLIIIVLMAGDAPDITKQIEVPTMDECLAEAKLFISQEKPDIKGSIGLGAQCNVLSEGDL